MAPTRTETNVDLCLDAIRGSRHQVALRVEVRDAPQLFCHERAGEEMRERSSLGGEDSEARWLETMGVSDRGRAWRGTR